MKVYLAHCKNPDVRPGGYWTAMKREKNHWEECANLNDAVSKVRSFIGRNDLGGGNWIGGNLMNEEGIQFARISYNGRIWKNENVQWGYGTQEILPSGHSVPQSAIEN